MINESIFCLQVVLVFAFTAIISRFGKEAMAGWMGLLAVMANLFISKQINLFGMYVTASDVYAVGLFLTLNMTQEYWGKEAGKQAIKIALWFQVFFLVFSQLHLFLVPSSLDQSQEAFQSILGIYPRILGASLFTLWIVQQSDLLVFSFLKNRFKNVSFSLRNIMSLLISQAMDTVLFTLLALSGEVESLIDIMLLSFVVKAALIFTTPLITAFPHKLKSLTVSS